MSTDRPCPEAAMLALAETEIRRLRAHLGRAVAELSAIQAMILAGADKTALVHAALNELTAPETGR